MRRSFAHVWHVVMTMMIMMVTCFVHTTYGDDHTCSIASSSFSKWKSLNGPLQTWNDVNGGNVILPRLNVKHYMGMGTRSRQSAGITTSVAAMLGNDMAYVSSALHDGILRALMNQSIHDDDDRYDGVVDIIASLHVKPLSLPFTSTELICHANLALEQYYNESFIQHHDVITATHARNALYDSQWNGIDVMMTSPYHGITNFYDGPDIVIARVPDNNSIDVVPFIRYQTSNLTNPVIFAYDSSLLRVGVSITPAYLAPSSILGYDVRAQHDAQSFAYVGPNAGLAPSWPIEVALRLTTSSDNVTSYVVLVSSAINTDGTASNRIYCIDESPNDGLLYECTRDWANPSSQRDYNDRVPRYPQLTSTRAAVYAIVYSCPRYTSDVVDLDAYTLAYNNAEDDAMRVLLHHTNGLEWNTAVVNTASAQRQSSPDIHSLIVAAMPDTPLYNDMDGSVMESANMTCILYGGAAPSAPSNVKARIGLDPLSCCGPRLLISFDVPHGIEDGGASIRNYTWDYNITYATTLEAHRLVDDHFKTMLHIWPTMQMDEFDIEGLLQFGMPPPSLPLDTQYQVNFTVALIASSIWGVSLPSLPSNEVVVISRKILTLSIFVVVRFVMELVDIHFVYHIAEVCAHNGGCDPLRNCSKYVILLLHFDHVAEHNLFVVTHVQG
jgi:hypothetical protein